MGVRLDSWETATTPAGACDAPPLDAAWRPADRPQRGSDADDHWFRHRFDGAGPDAIVRLGGLATICDVYLDGEHALRSESMFVAHELRVGAGGHELAVCARALDPVLATPRRPRARWRSAVPRDGNLRWIRTTLLGRAPGFAPGPPVVGPWRAVTVHERAPLRLTVRPRWSGAHGTVTVRADAAVGPLEVELAGTTTTLPPGGGDVHVVDAEPWWPHTHGDPRLHPLRVRADGAEEVRRVGFRRLELEGSPDAPRFALLVNGVEIFARGVVWTPVPEVELRPTLSRLRDAGLNLVRLAGTTVYESAAFHDLCDELGLLVWQDFMFANMDYPIVDPAFRGLVETEVRQALAEVAGRPSLAVLCGNSEVEQQVGMLGLDPAAGRGELFGELIPALVAEADADAVYLPSAPTGGDQPFRTNRGVANYFGVGAYLRPLEDARRAAVPFASECLAFANVPDAAPRDRAEGVMRDVGAEWTFADVRDHYLRLLHDAGPGDDDYWERARIVTGEVMAEVLGEWRRAESPTSGAILLWSRDLVPGSGWGILDDRGAPKAAWHHLRRALAPVAAWTTDEGLNGVDVHVANDGPHPLTASLRVALYRGESKVDEAREPLSLEPRAVVRRSVEEILGRFVDASYAYRFGEPQHDLVVASLEDGDELLAQAFRLPLGPPRRRESADELGLVAEARVGTDGAVELHLRARRFVHGVRVGAADASDDAFSLEPARDRRVRARASGEALLVSALNLLEPLRVAIA